MSFARPRGFTLIELLVVVAIIAVLITILVPSLNMARISAARTRCAAQMKQWGLAIHTYSSQNDSWIALNGWSSPGDSKNPSKYQPYFGRVSILKMANCPMFPARFPLSTSYKPTTYASTTGYNSAMGGTQYPAITDFKYGNCNHAASYLIMMDCYKTLNVHSYDDLDGNKFALKAPPNYKVDPDQPSGAPINTYLVGRVNTMFLDSHVTQDSTLKTLKDNLPLAPTKGNEVRYKAWLYLKWPA